MKNIIVLGSKGMLGQMVSLFFSKNGYNIIEFNTRFTEENSNLYFAELNKLEDGFVINCIGRIKQKSGDAFNLLLSNTIFPLALSSRLKHTHFLIHPSTDCIFDGKADSPYCHSAPHTALDVYGWSKSLGETAIKKSTNSIIIRVSIIGPDNNSDKGLLSWFLSQPKGSHLRGYINHYWNGITTLEWCKILNKIILNKKLLLRYRSEGIVQLGTDEIYSKFDMLNIFNDYYETKFKITPVQEESTYRCLQPIIKSNSFEIQMTELIDFWPQACNS